MHSMSFAGKPLLDPRSEARNLVACGKPVPADFSRCNCLVNPLGQAPARGWLLMLRSDLNAINLNALHNLILTDDIANTVAAHSLVITREPMCLTPSYRPGDNDASYMVEVADARWRCFNPNYCVPVNKQYNVVAPAYLAAGSNTQYYADSLTGGIAWTWQQLVQDLWGLMSAQLGTAPALPIAPGGTPTGWIFTGEPAWLALCAVLDRIGCAVKWTPTAATGAYSIVQVGAADTASDAILARVAGRKIHDAEFLPIVRGKVPYGVRMFFNRSSQYAGTEETATRTSSQWQTGSVYSVDVVGPDSASAEAGVYHPLWDDMTANYSPDGTLQNAAALSTRATERANDYYRQLRGVGGERLHKSYSGLVSIAPGSTLRGVAWRQDSQAAWATEIVRHPQRMLRVDDDATWRECELTSVPVQPPEFAPTHPVWPSLLATLRIETAAVSSGRFDCSIQRPDGVGGRTTRESVFGVDLCGATTLTVGDLYLCRLAGFTSSRPLWEFFSAAVLNNVTILNNLFFGTTDDQSVYTGGVLVLPTCTVAGPPTWVPTTIGVIWWSNVDGTLYVWDGTNWIPIGGGGSTTGRAWEHYRHIGPASVFASGRKRWYPVTVHTDFDLIVHGVNENTIFALPHICPTGRILEVMAVELQSGFPLAGETAKCRMAIYDSDTSFGQVSRYPTTRLLLSEEKTINYTVFPQRIQFHNDNLAEPIFFTFEADKLYWFVFIREYLEDLSDHTFTTTSLIGGAAADVLGCEVDAVQGKFTKSATHLIVDPWPYGDGLPSTFPEFATPVPNDGSAAHICIFLWYHHEDDDPAYGSAQNPDADV